MLEKVGHLIRTAFFAEEDNEDRPFAVDYVWYLWCGKDSPAFDKDKMATFERYFLKEKELHKEVKGHYYSLRNEEKVCDMLLDEFGEELHGPWGHRDHCVEPPVQRDATVRAQKALLAG